MDRVACPWLITRLVDPEAEFLFVEETDLLEESKRHGAPPFDAPKIEAIKLNHRGPRCTFEAIIEDYSITDPAIHQLGLIVRAADVNGQESVASEGVGPRSIAQGFAANNWAPTNNNCRFWYGRQLQKKMKRAEPWDHNFTGVHAAFAESSLLFPQSSKLCAPPLMRFVIKFVQTNFITRASL